MKNTLLKKITKVGGSIVIIVAGIIYSYIGVKIANTLTHVPRKTTQETPGNYNLPFTDITFPSRDNKVKLSGWYISYPKNTSSLIIVNGIGDTRANLQRLDLASRLTKEGFNILLFDLRGQGTSEGDIASGGYFEQQDVLGAVDYVTTSTPHSACVGILGASMGAASSILAATQEEKIQAIVADSSFADINDVITNEAIHASSLPPWSIPYLLPGIKQAARILYGIELDTLKPEEAVRHISYPLFFIHSTIDDRIPVGQSERLVKAAAPGSEIWLTNEAGHANIFAHFPQEYIQKVSSYFHSRFKASEICKTQS